MASGRDETRQAFLDAGVRMFGTMSDRLLRGYTAGAVAAEAGYRRQTFYRYWDTQADYVHDLIEYVLEADSPAADGMAVLPTRRGTAGDWSGLVRDIARYDYGRMAGDPRVTMRLGLAAIGAPEDATLQGRAQAFYDGVIERMGGALETALNDQGRAPRPGLSSRDLARVQRALIIGLLVFELGASDDYAGADLFEDVFGVILDALTEDVD